MQEIRRLLVANRSEIAIRIFRAGHELEHTVTEVVTGVDIVKA